MTASQKLTEKQIFENVLFYLWASSGRFPGQNSKELPILWIEDKSWSAVYQAVYHKLSWIENLKGCTNLTELIDRNIARVAKEHVARTGNWKIHDDEPFGDYGISWGLIREGLYNRGKSHRSSLEEILERYHVIPTKPRINLLSRKSP